MNSLDCVSLVLAEIKDKVRQEISDDFCESYTCLLESEAQARRMKVQTDIVEMAKLRIALSKFETAYNKVKCQCGTIDSVEKYISEIRKRISRISLKKNKPLVDRL